ncbi:MAG: phosphopantetheine-binding protein [Pseudomonadota bacterium]
MNIDNKNALLVQVAEIIGSSTGLEGCSRWSRETPLFGAIPELDSQSLMVIMMALEERFEIQIETDDLSLEALATLGAFTNLVEKKLQAT